MEIFIDNKKIFPADAKQVDQSFDLNSLFDGWVKCNGNSVPKNAPTSGYSFYRNLTFMPGTVMQLAYVLNYSSDKSTVNLYSRVMASNKWQGWTKNFQCIPSRCYFYGENKMKQINLRPPPAVFFDAKNYQ